MNQGTENKKNGGHTCPWWLLFTFDNPVRKLLHNPEAILSPYVKKGDTVLDVGCGMGYFSLPLARLVGEGGKVFAADLQQRMLAGVRVRAERTDLLDRIELHQCTPTQIGVGGPVDFALAFWMVHEVRQPLLFLDQVYKVLNPGGRLLVVEPRIHVTAKNFERLMADALGIGFRAAHHPKVWSSRAVLLQK